MTWTQVPYVHCVFYIVFRCFHQHKFNSIILFHRPLLQCYNLSQLGLVPPAAHLGEPTHYGSGCKQEFICIFTCWLSRIVVQNWRRVSHILYITDHIYLPSCYDSVNYTVAWQNVTECQKRLWQETKVMSPVCFVGLTVQKTNVFYLQWHVTEKSSRFSDLRSWNEKIFRICSIKAIWYLLSELLIYPQLGLKTKGSWCQPHLNTCTSHNLVLCLVSGARQWRELSPTPAAESPNACEFLSPPPHSLNIPPTRSPSTLWTHRLLIHYKWTGCAANKLSASQKLRDSILFLSCEAASFHAVVVWFGLIS